MKNWQLLQSEQVLTTPWLSVCKNRYRVAANEIIDDYYLVSRQDFVLILAMEGQHLVLVRQYRPATDRHYLCLPGGYLELGESPEEGARRELPEETGYAATNCRLLAHLDPLPSFVRSRGYYILCQATPTGTGIVDRTEIDEVVKVEWDGALAMITRGEIDEMQAVAGILLADRVLNSA